MRFPILLDMTLLKHLDDTGIARVKTFALAIGPDEVKIRAVMQEPKGTAAEMDPNGRKRIVGRDVGITNTVTWSVIEVDAPIDPARVEWLAEVAHLHKEEEGKAQMRAFIETHEHPMDNIIAELVVSATNFRERAARHFRYIDKISAEISGIYNKMDRLKPILLAYFGLKPEVWIPEDIIPVVPSIRRVHQKFFDLLKQVQRLKQKRRERYDRVEGLKKSWLGHLANQEVTIAKLFNASVAREKLTYKAIPKDSPLYKGHRFNRDINISCRGRYARMAADKLAWAHIPELIVPSYYTSKACLIHSLPEGWRKDVDYRCPLCGEKVHADAHAAATIGLLLLLARLRQVPSYVRNSPTGAPADQKGPASQEASATPL